MKATFSNVGLCVNVKYKLTTCCYSRLYPHDPASLLVFCLPFSKDIILAGGSEGYPVRPTHADLRDTEIATSMEANLDEFRRMSVLVDLTRSVW